MAAVVARANVVTYDVLVFVELASIQRNEMMTYDGVPEYVGAVRGIVAPNSSSLAVRVVALHSIVQYVNYMTGPIYVKSPRLDNPPMGDSSVRPQMMLL